MGSLENLTTDKNKDFTFVDQLRATWYFLKGHRAEFVVIVAGLAVVYLYAFFPPWVFGKIVDQLTNYAGTTSLDRVYELIVILGISWIVSSVLRLTLKNKLGNLAALAHYRVKVEGFERLMDYSLKWHQQENTGNKIQRIETGSNMLRQFLVSIHKYILISVSQFVGAIVIIGSQGPHLFLFTGIYLLCFYINDRYFSHKIREANDRYNQMLENSSGTTFEGATNVLTIKTLGVKKRLTTNVADNEARARDHNIAIRYQSTRKFQAFQILNGLAFIIFGYLLVQEFLTGSLTAGAIFVYLTYLQTLVRSTGDVGELSVDLLEQKTGIARMVPIFWEGEIAAEGTRRFPKQWTEISLNNASFAYDPVRPVLKDMTLVIKRGEKVGIVGRSGSGKSTLAKLMLGLYDVARGSYTIGQTPFADIGHTDRAHHISAVLQETELFNLSLRENLTLYKTVDPELLVKAIRIAKLSEVVAKLPQGLDTLIGEKGYKLSGGERQRVGIARAICSGAEILVFDEATSSLDSKTELAIQTALERELAQKTMVIIAHRLSTLKHVDRIIVFDKGQIIEEGSYQQLLKQRGSKFAELHRLQSQRDKQRPAAFASPTKVS